MPLTESEIALLLYQSESEALDFKREQYRFSRASDDDKAELLKDVLAFANAWRDKDALILVGAEEQKGAPATVVGIAPTDHLDDADLQQFVNRKTNRPVVFSYEQAQYRGLHVGCIRVPVQTRPLFAKKKCGNKVEANTVYVRRGSSTDAADPDEVTKMCEARIAARVPDIRLDLADAESRDVLSPPRVEIIHTTGDLPRLEIRQPRREPWNLSISLDHPYPEFPIKFARYVVKMRALAQLRIVAINSSMIRATHVRAELFIETSPPEMLVLDAPLEIPLRRQGDLFRNMESIRSVIDQQTARTSEIELRGAKRVLKANMRSLSPGAYETSHDILYVGGAPGTLRLHGRLTCDEAMPTEVDLKLEVISRDAPLTLKELLAEQGRIYDDA